MNDSVATANVELAAAKSQSNRARALAKAQSSKVTELENTIDALELECAITLDSFEAANLACAKMLRMKSAAMKRTVPTSRHKSVIKDYDSTIDTLTTALTKQAERISQQELNVRPGFFMKTKRPR